jgi:hypothetical protein
MAEVHDKRVKEPMPAAKVLVKLYRITSKSHAAEYMRRYGTGIYCNLPAIQRFCLVWKVYACIAHTPGIHRYIKGIVSRDE